MNWIVAILIRVFISLILVWVLDFILDRMLVIKKEEIDVTDVYINTVGVSRIYFVCALGFGGIVAVLSIIPTREMVVTIVGGGIVLLLVIVSYLYKRYYIWITMNNIRFCNFFEKEKSYSWDVIEYYEIDEQGALKLFDSTGCILKIESRIDRDKLINILQSKTIRKNNQTQKEFIMQATTLYRGISVFSVCGGISFFILALYVQSFFGIILFGILLLALLRDCVQNFSDRIIVDRRGIQRRCLLKKNCVIDFSEIESVKIKRQNNAEYLYIYTKRGGKMKISLLYRNAERLRQVVKNRHLVK